MESACDLISAAREAASDADSVGKTSLGVPWGISGLMGSAGPPPPQDASTNKVQNAKGAKESEYIVDIPQDNLNRVIALNHTITILTLGAERSQHSIFFKCPGSFHGAATVKCAFDTVALVSLRVSAAGRYGHVPEPYGRIRMRSISR